MSHMSEWIRSQSLRRMVATAALAAAVTAGGLAPAEAARTSPRTNGCFAWWDNGLSDAHCQPANRTGYYRLTGTCDWQPGYIGSWRYFRSGAWADGWDVFTCTFNVTSARIEYTG